MFALLLSQEKNHWAGRWS